MSSYNILTNSLATSILSIEPFLNHTVFTKRYQSFYDLRCYMYAIKKRCIQPATVSTVMKLTVAQMKELSLSTYGEKVGNWRKYDIATHLSSLQYLCAVAIKIQKVFRRHLVTQLVKLSGIKHFDKIVNVEDCITMEPLHKNSSIMIVCTNNFYYGFELNSLHSIIDTSYLKGLVPQNPYTRSDLNPDIINGLHTVIRTSHILGYPSLFTLDFINAIELNYIYFKLCCLAEEKGLYIDAEIFWKNPVDLLNTLWNKWKLLRSTVKKEICQSDPFVDVSVDTTTSWCAIHYKIIYIFYKLFYCYTGLLFIYSTIQSLE